MMWGLLMVVLACTAAIPGMADDATRSVTLPEALDMLATQNPEALTARLQIVEAQAERITVGLYPNPSLSADAANIPAGRTNPPGLSVGETIGTSLRLDQPLILWGKRRLRLDGAEVGIVVAKDLEQDVLRHLRAAVKVAFYDSLHDERQLAFVEANQKRYEEVVSLNERRFRGGDISEAEFRKIQLEQLKYTAQYEDAQRGVAESRQLLGRLLGVGDAVDAKGELDAPSVTLGTDDLVQLAAQNRPDWAALQHQRERADLALQLARRERYPDVTVGADFTHSEFVLAGDNRNTVGFGLSVPLPLLNQNQGEIAKAEVALRRADADLARLRLDIAQEVQNARTAYESAQRLRRTFEHGYLDAAKLTVDAAEASYRIGAASLIELLDAERTYTATQTDYVDTVFAARSSLTTLEQALGKDLGAD